MSRKHSKPKELTQEEFDKVLQDLEQFHEQFFIALAGTSEYEVVPTVTDMGKPLTKEQYTYVKTECSRLGKTILYKIDMPNGISLYINLETNKVGYVDEGMH